MAERAVDLAGEAQTLLSAHRYAETLALLEAAAPGALEPGRAALVRAEALAALERYGEAHDLLGRLLENGALATPDRLAARLLRARGLRRASSYIDAALAEALATAAAAERLGGAAAETGGEARLEAAHLYARKGCRRLAEREVGRAALLLAGDPRVAFAEGHVLLAFDERAAARDRFAAALAAGGVRGARLGRRGLAHLETLAGEFAAAHAHLGELGAPTASDLLPRRLRGRLFAAEQRWDELATLLGAVLAASPTGDFARGDAYDRAAALHRAGHRDEARAAFAALAAEGDPRDGWARLARRMVERLERAGATHREERRRLREFPSVSQLRNHCGPATLELYLRFFGVPAEQVEVARAVKFPEGGTPVYRMRRYLDGAGFATRRVEAELPLLRRLIDAGVPVIMEEDYSDSRHVAVAIGYDDERELLEVQDPMTHEVRETGYEELPRLRNLSNHGALVAVPRARLAALDAAGAVECRYITAVDEAWAAHDEGRFDDADRLADESVALRRDYELAWLYRFHRARHLAEKEPTAARRAAMQRIVDEVVRLWPDDEWPQQLAGDLLLIEGRHAEALVAFERARDRDPDDAHNWAAVADCLIGLGRRDDARGALEEALRKNPAHRRANENLAWLEQQRGEDDAAWMLNECARELAPGNPFNHGVHARLLQRRGELAEAVAAYDRALAIDPDRAGYRVDRAKLLCRDGRVDEAAADLRGAFAGRPRELPLRVELADLLYAHGRPGDAVAVCEEILAIDPEAPAGHAILGAARCAGGELEAGLAAMRAALARRPVYAWVHAEMGRHLSAAGRHVEAVTAHAAALGLSGSPLHELALGDALARAGFPEDAARALRQAARSGALSEAQLGRVGEVLADAEGGEAAHRFFEELGGERPGDVALLRAHVRTLVEVLWAPATAAPVLERLSAAAPGDPFAVAARGAALMDRSLRHEASGEALLRAAVAAGGPAVYPRRALATRLLARGRFAEALETLAPCPKATVAERVAALLGLERWADAEAAIAGLEADAPLGALALRYRVARRRRDYAAALELAERLSREHHERDDDGRLDRWEQEKFECLARLGAVERALAFALRQATDAPSLAALAESALAAARLPLAEELAGRALRLHAEEPAALHVAARLAELRGETDAALALWERAAAAVEGDDDHHWREEVARVLLGDAPERAADLADAAAEAGHTCAGAFAVRAQARLLTGDRDGARADLERAWALASPELRERERRDVWALRRLLGGDRPGAEALFAAWLAEEPASPADRARVARIREAAGG